MTENEFMEERAINYTPDKCINCVYNNKNKCDKDFCGFAGCIYDNKKSSEVVISDRLVKDKE